MPGRFHVDYYQRRKVYHPAAIVEADLVCAGSKVRAIVSRLCRLVETRDSRSGPRQIAAVIQSECLEEARAQALMILPSFGDIEQYALRSIEDAGAILSCSCWDDEAILEAILNRVPPEQHGTLKIEFILERDTRDKTSRIIGRS
jgi:hypothetical protein